MTDPNEENVTERVARLQAALEDIQRRTAEPSVESQELIDNLRRKRQARKRVAPAPAAGAG